MPFEIVTKNARVVKGDDESVIIQFASIRFPPTIRDSLGIHVSALMDREAGKVAFRNAQEDDRNAYTMTRWGRITCFPVRYLAEKFGVRIGHSPSFPVAYDAELDAWVIDLHDAQYEEDQS